MEDIKVGDKRGIIGGRGWGGVFFEGIYKIVKIDKVKIVLEREGDGYQRTFSAKTGIEKGSNSYRTPLIITVDDYTARQESVKKQNIIVSQWDLIKEHANNQKLSDLKAAISELEELLK